MGGHSRWNILSDTKLSMVLPEVFLPAPEIVSGFLQNEVEAIFRKWNPLIWQVIKTRGVFVGDVGESSSAQTPRARGLTARLARLLRNLLIDRIRQV
jgi:tRNA(adenine34) deaminase